MDKREFLESFLDDSEQEVIKHFVANETMKQAVKKVILSGIYQMGTLKKGEPAMGIKAGQEPMNFALVMACRKGVKYEDIGRDVKACWEGMNALQLAFDDLELFSEVETPEPKPNQAR